MKNERISRDVCTCIFVLPIGCCRNLLRNSINLGCQLSAPPHYSHHALGAASSVAVGGEREVDFTEAASL